MRVAIWLALSLLIPFPAVADEDGYELAFHAGFPQIEFEYRAPIGLFADLGIPWWFWLNYGSDEADTSIALTAKVGYQFRLNTYTSLRFGVRANYLYADDCSCYICDGEPYHVTMVYTDICLRFRLPFGLVLGVDLPLVGLWTKMGCLEDRDRRSEFVALPEIILFASAYLGYSMRF